MTEPDWKKIIDKKYDIFDKRYAETYPEAYLLMNEIGEDIQNMFEKISPFYGEKRHGNFDISEDGEITSCEPFPIMLGAIGKVIKKEQDLKLNKVMNELQKIQRYLKYAIPELEELIECPFCKEYNPPDGLYCIRCTKKITMEKSNEKDK